MQGLNSYGKISIEQKAKPTCKVVKKRWGRKIVKVVFKLTLSLLVLTSGSAALYFGPGLTKQYLAVNKKMKTVLAHEYSVVRGGEVKLKSGDNLNQLHLFPKLSILGYSQLEHQSVSPGQYYLTDSRLLLFPQTTTAYGEPVIIDLKDGNVELITSSSGRVMDVLVLERPVLTSFSNSMWEVRYPAQFNEIPESLWQAITATEDNRFWDHPGLDVKGIARAAIANYKEGRVVQGGSTITQQLTKCLMNRNGRDYGVKLQELVLAVVLDCFYTKEQILEAYCNTIYMGRVGPFSIHGMEAAAKHLLQKELSELTPQECAVLAGMIRSPNPLSPLRHPKETLERANIVLTQMGMKRMMIVDPKVGETILSNLDNSSSELLPLAWYVQEVKKEVAKQLDTAQLNRTLTIDTALDPVLQNWAQKVVNTKLAEFEKKKKFAPATLQSALAAVDVESGAVRALIGGRSFTKNEFNRAVDSRRQVGSLIKPFVYLAAMEQEDSLAPFQSRIVKDKRLVRTIAGKRWEPSNYDRKFKGPVSWRKALATSRNIPAVKIGEQAGIENVRSFISRVGISENPDKGPALFLGSLVSSPVKMAAAYRTIAAGGEYTEPHLVESILVDDIMVHTSAKGKAVIDPAISYVMTDMLKAVLSEGTGRSIHRYGVEVETAGKTGTSNDLVDGWFTGFTADLAMTVWVGKDSHEKAGFTGASSALPIWASVVEKFGNHTERHLEIPAGVEFVPANPWLSKVNGKKSPLMIARTDVRPALLVNEAVMFADTEPIEEEVLESIDQRFEELRSDQGLEESLAANEQEVAAPVSLESVRDENIHPADTFLFEREEIKPEKVATPPVPKQKKIIPRPAESKSPKKVVKKPVTPKVTSKKADSKTKKSVKATSPSKQYKVKGTPLKKQRYMMFQ